jgi:hypothetical protein
MGWTKDECTAASNVLVPLIVAINTVRELPSSPITAAVMQCLTACYDNSRQNYDLNCPPLPGPLGHGGPPK